MDSLEIDYFLFDTGHWHRLDNLGCIAGLITLIVYFIDLEDDGNEELLNLSGLFIAMICQEGYPWDIFYTLLPLLPFALILAYRLFRMKRGLPKHNLKAF
jgi:hypothetical protein